MADDGRIAFGIGIEYSELLENAEKVKKVFEELGQFAIREGNHIDDVFKRIGSDYGLDIDVSSIEAKISVLTAVIQQAENEASNLDKKIGEMGAEAANALRDGDLETYKGLIKQLVQLQKEYTDTTLRIADYRKTLKELSLTTGILHQERRDVSMVFASEEDYNRAKQLKEEIKDLQANIAEVQLSDKFDVDVLVTMQENLIDLNKELDTLEGNAAKTASALGEKLGSQTSEVQSRFYELNAAVKEQTRILNELNTQLAATEKELASATQSGDVQKVAALQLKYSYLAEQVRNAGDALADLEGQQKDAEGAFDSLQNQIGGVVDAIGNLISGKASFRTIITSIGQISGLFKKSGTGLTAINTGLRGMGGAATLAKVSIKGLWATITANPIGAIVAAIAGLIAIMVKLAQSIKTTSDKQLEAAQIEAADLKYTESVAKRKMDAYDEAIRAKQREIDVAKSANKSNAEIYKLEDERYRLQRDKAKWQEGYYGEYIANLDTEYAKLDDLNQQLRAAEHAQISGESKFEITIDGKTNKADIEKQIDILKQMIENTEANIKIGVDAKEAVAVAEAEQKKYENEKRQQALQIANVERQALRDAANARIELMGDSYAREVAMAQEASKNRISDLRRRLKEEANLTVAARKAINENIETEEKLLQKKLLELERGHVQEVKNLWRDVEELQASARPQTMSQEGINLLRKFIQDDDAIQQQINIEENPQKRVALLAKQNALYEKFLYDREELGKQHAERVTANEEQAIQLRLEAAQEGSVKELQLKLQFIDKQRQAELERNRHLVEEQRQDEAVINAKYDRQRENTQKEYYDNLYDQYGTFEQRRQQIAVKYAKLRDNLYIKNDKGNMILAPGVSQSNIDELNRQELDALNALMAEEDALYGQWLDRLDNMTIEKLKEMLSEAKRTLAALWGSGAMSPEEMNAALARIKAIEDALKKAKLSPDRKDITSWELWSKTLAEAANEIQNIGSAMDGVGGEVVSSLGTIIGTTIETITRIQEIHKTVVEAIKTSSSAAVSSIKAVETASVVLTVISTAISLMRKLADLSNGISQRKAEEETRAWQKAVDELTKAYDKLGKAVDAAMGTNKVRGLEEQIKTQMKLVEEYRKRIERLRQKLDDLEGKKKSDPFGLTWSQDEIDKLKDEISGLEGSIYDIMNNVIPGLEEGITEAIYGTDVQSAIEGMTDAMTSAWEDGKSSVKSVRDYVLDMMKDMIRQSILAMVQNSDVMKSLMERMSRYILSVQLKGLGAAVTLAGEAGQVISDSFGLTSTMLSGMLDDMANDIDNSPLGRLYRGLVEQQENERTASRKGIANASQESVDELNGRASAIQGHTFNISANSTIIRGNVEAILGSVRQIERNTEAIKNDLYIIKKDGVKLLS